MTATGFCHIVGCSEGISRSISRGYTQAHIAHRLHIGDIVAYKGYLVGSQIILCHPISQHIEFVQPAAIKISDSTQGKALGKSRRHSPGNYGDMQSLFHSLYYGIAVLEVCHTTRYAVIAKGHNCRRQNPVDIKGYAAYLLNRVIKFAHCIRL